MNYALEPCEEWVQRFTGHSSGYVIYLENGSQLDVAKCRNFLPEDACAEDHEHFLWVHAIQGFFMLRQHVQGNFAGPWCVVAEVKPEEFSASFFELFLDELPQVCRKLIT